MMEMLVINKIALKLGPFAIHWYAILIVTGSVIGVSPAAIHNWVKGAKSVELEDGTEVTSKEFKQLQKENQRLKEELEILKAAAVLLGKH